jgi:hypothetical protein
MAVPLFAVVVAVAATTFGIGFAPEAHREEGAGEHAEAVEEAGTEAEPEEASHAEEEPKGATAGAIVSSILISLAAVALVPLALVPARRSQAPVGFADRSQADHGPTVVGAAAVVVASIALFQLAWGLLVLIQPSALVYVAGAIANALIIVTWIVSRTTGVPVGPEAGEAEAVSFPDALATAFEVVLVVVLVALLAERSARRPARHFPPAAAGLGGAAVVASLTGLALRDTRVAEKSQAGRPSRLLSRGRPSARQAPLEVRERNPCGQDG